MRGAGVARFVPATWAHACGRSDATELALSVEAEPIEDVLPVEDDLAVYRVVREALSNTVRHAGANAARVRIAPEAGAVVTTVEDDGRGFVVDDVMDGARGLGLVGMRERAGYVGGRVEIQSAPGERTRVRVEVPAGEVARDG